MAPSAHYGSTLAADRDGDGHIEPKEISTIMRCVGTPISDEKARELIDSVDQDKNGKVRARASKPSPQPPRAQLPPRARTRLSLEVDAQPEMQRLGLHLRQGVAMSGPVLRW